MMLPPGNDSVLSGATEGTHQSMHQNISRRSQAHELRTKVIYSAEGGSLLHQTSERA